MAEAAGYFTTNDLTPEVVEHEGFPPEIAAKLAARNEAAAAVDETRELVDMMETARTYQNNVEVMQTAKTLILDTLKMGR